MSKTIDERVVSMEFDNRDFEKNVAITLVTLDKLKESLKLDGASKGLTDVGKAAESIDLSSVSTSAENVGYSFSLMEQIATAAVYRITNAVLDLGHKMVANVINPITSGGLTRAMNIEQASFQLEGLGIEKSNKALSYYDEVMQAVLGTAYSYDVAAKAASQLAASNIGVTETTKTLSNGLVKNTKIMNKDMTDALLAMAGVASMTGSDFDSIAQIFTRVAGQGKVTANDLNSLASRGLNAAATLADFLGTTEADVRELVHDGEINFTIFSNAMRDAFGDHAKDSTKMFTGALEDTKAALARIGADFYGPALESARDFFNAFTPLVDSVHDKINGVIKSMTDYVDVASRKAQGFMRAMSYSLNILDTIEGRALNLHGQTVVGGLEQFSKMRDEYKNIYSDLAAHFGKTEDELIESLNSGEISLYKFRIAMVKIAKTYNKDFGIDTAVKDVWKVWDTIVENRDQYEKVSDAYGKSSKAVHQAIGVLSKDFDKIYAKGQHKAIDVMKILEDQTGKTTDEINKMIDAGKFGFQDLRRILKESVEDYGYDLVAVWEQLGVVSKDYIATNKDTMLAINNAKSFFSLLKSVTTVLKTIGKIVSTVFGGIFSIIAPIVKTIIDVVGAVAQGISDAIDEYYDNGDEKGEGIISVIKEITSKLVLTEDQLEKISGVVNGIMATIFFANTLAGKLFDIIVKFLKGLFGLNNADLVDWLAQLGDALMKLKGDIFGSKGLAINFEYITNTITGLITGLSNLIDKFWALEDVQKIVGKLRELFSQWYEAGVNVIHGFIEGIRSGKSKVFNVLKDIGQGILNFLKSILGIQSPSKETYFIGQMTIQGFFNGIVDSINELFPNLKAAFSNFIDLLKGLFASIDFSQLLAGLLSIANVVVAKKIFAFANALIKPLTSLSSVFGGLATALTSLGGYIKKKTISIYADAFKSVAIGLMVLIGGIILISKFATQDDIDRAANILGVVGVFLSVFAAVISKLAKTAPILTKGSKLARTFRPTGLIAVAASVLIMAVALSKLSKIDPERLWESVAVMTIVLTELVAIMGGFAALKSFDAAGFKMASKSLLMMAATMLVLTIVMRRIAKMKDEDIARSLIVIGALGLFFVAFQFLMTKATTLKAGKTGAAQANLLIMAGAMLVMMYVIKIAASFSKDQIGQAALILGGLLVFFKILTSMAIKNSKAIDHAAAIFAAVAASIWTLAKALKILAKIDGLALAKGIVALTFILGELWAFIVAISVADNLDKGSVLRVAGIMIAISISMNIMASAMMLLSGVKWGGVVKGIVVLAAITGALSVLMTSVKRVGANTAKSLTILMASLAVLLGTVVALTFVKPERLWKATAAVVAIVGALAATVFAMGKLSQAGSVGKSGFLIIAVLLAELAGITLALTKFANTDNALDAAKGISLVLAAMSTSIFALSKMTKFSWQALGAVTVLGLIVVGLAAIFSKLGDEMSGDKALKIASSISLTIATLAGVLAVVAAVGKFSSPVAMMEGIGGLSVLILALAAVFTALGGIFEEIQGAEKWLDKGITVMEKMGAAIGKFFGAIVGEFVGTALNHSTESIQEFLDTVMPFISAFADVDMNSVKTMGKVSESLKSFGGISLGELDPSLKDTLPDLAIAIKEFATNLGTFDEEQLKSINAAVKIMNSIAEMSKNAGSGITSISENVSSLPEIGGYIGEYITKLTDSGITADAAKTANIATSIIQKISEAAKTLDSNFLQSSEGGAQKLAAFKSLSDVADGLAEYVNTCLENGLANTSSEQYQATVNATNAINDILTAASGMKATGGWLQKVIGDSSLVSLADSLPLLATAMAGFVTNLGPFSEDNAISASNAAKAIKAVSDNLADAKITGLFGKEQTANFIAVLPDIGSGIKEMVANLGNTDTSKVNTLADAMASFSKLGSVDLNPEKVKKFADAVVELVTKVGGLTTSQIDSTTNNFKTLESGMANLGKTDFSSSLNSLKSNMSNLAKNSVSALTSNFNSSESTSSAKTAMQSLISGVVSGVKTNDNYKSWKEVGKYLVDGFVDGINANTYKAIAKARAMANAAERAAKDALGEQSPSKVFYGIGAYVVDGFVNAIHDGTKTVSSTSSNMASVANNSFKMALDSISELENTDLDLAPRITPVVDLSNATRSIGQLNTMFSRSQAFNVSASMGRSQNRMDQMMSSILTGLKDVNSTHQTNNYTLNGLTYSNGSEIAQAMEVIANAVLVNGRA